MSRLIVKNLPEKIKEEKFREIFSSAGQITDLKLCFTRKGIFRKFGFVGYQNETDAKNALNQLDKTFINTNKISIEICKDLGDDTAPRAWSKYSKDSSAHSRKTKEIQERKDRIKKLQESEEKPKLDEKKKKGNNKKVLKQLEDVEEDEGFQEFLEVHGGSKNKTWTDQTVAPYSAKEVEQTTGEPTQQKANEIEMEGDDDSDVDTMNADSANLEEPAEVEQIKMEVATKEVDTALSSKKTSDLDWLKSKVTKTEGESTASTETTTESRESQPMEENESESPQKSKKKKKKKSSQEANDPPVSLDTCTTVKSATLKLRGVPFKCTEADVIKFFKPLNILDIRFPKDKKDRPSGYAFVDFADRQAAQDAMKKNGKKMKGRYIELFTEVNDKPSDGNKKYNKNGEWLNKSDEPVDDISESGRLFIRNLPYTCTEEDIQTLFEKYGTLSEINLPIDKNNNKATGFAFVTFMMPEHAVKALSALDGKIFQGRLLHLLPGRAQKSKVNKDGESGEMTSSYKKKKEVDQKSLSGSSHNWNALFLGANAVADVMADRLNTTKKNILDSEGSGSVAVRMALGETELVTETRQFLESHGVKLDVFGQATTARSKNILLVKNLPPGTTTKELLDLFSQHGDLGRLLMPPFGITAIVEYITQTDAKKAFINLAYSKFKHLPLYLEWAPLDVLSGEITAKPESQETNKDASEESSEEDEGETEGTSIFVKNLNFNTTEEKLKEVFLKCGKLRQVTVAKKKDPKRAGQMLSMGYGFVEYKRKADADKAIKLLQNVDLDNHKLELKKSHRETTGSKTSRKRAVDKEQTTSKIIVRNVPFEATEKEIKELFSSFGHIKSVRLPKKMAGTGTHRGFAFVDFTTKQDAKTAFQALCQSTHLYGRRLVLEWAEEDESIQTLRHKTAQHYHEGTEPQAKRGKADLVATLQMTNPGTE